MSLSHLNTDENRSNITSYDDNDGPSLYIRIIFAISWIFISVAGILGNGLVIFVAIRFEKLTNVTNCFIVNLAITDIVFLAFCMPLLVVQYTFEYWYFNQTFCKLLNFTSFLSVLVTVLTLVAMTIDRYMYVVHPFEDIKWRKPRTVFLLSLIIWSLSGTLASPFYFHYGVTDDEIHKQCVLLTDEIYQKHFRIYTVTLYYFIPLTIIIVCYTKLLYYVYSKEKKFKLKSKSNVAKWSNKRRAVTKMVAIVTLVFSLCWLPITLYIMSGNVFENKNAFLYYFKMIANSLAYLNSAVNPIIYAFLNRSFQNNCGNILFRRTRSLLCCQNIKSINQQTPNQRNSNHQKKNYYSTTDNRMTFDTIEDLSPKEQLNNNFSEAEDETPDNCDIPQLTTDKFGVNNEYKLEQYKRVLIVTNDAVNSALTTSL